jgi:hypothetical protein
MGRGGGTTKDYEIISVTESTEAYRIHARSTKSPLIFFPWNTESILFAVLNSQKLAVK